MKKMKGLWMLPLILFVFASCGNTKSSKGDEMKADSIAADSLSEINYIGVYEGTLPAADGPGIMTTLVVNPDSTFTLTSVYIDKKDGKFVEAGYYSVSDSIMTLGLKNGSKTYYQIEEGRVRMLDQNMKPITGELENNYVLEQITIAVDTTAKVKK